MGKGLEYRVIYLSFNLGYVDAFAFFKALEYQFLNPNDVSISTSLIG